MYIHALTSSIVMSTTVDDTKVTLLTLNAPGATIRTHNTIFYHNIVVGLILYPSWIGYIHIYLTGILQQSSAIGCVCKCKM